MSVLYITFVTRAHAILLPPPQLLQQLYEGDVLSEEALLSWAAEKEHADESDKVYLLKVCVVRGKAWGS